MRRSRVVQKASYQRISATHAVARIKPHLQRKCIKSQDMRLIFYTLKEKKFLYRNFLSSVFGEVQTQIVGKTKFFDSFGPPQ